MKKNKNIFWHIIEEDYKIKSENQSQCFDVSGKAILFTDPQHKGASVVEQLKKLHQPFMVTEESEMHEPNDELNQTNQQDSLESTNSLNDSELNAFSQKIETEEQELIDHKQDMQSQEHDLREKLLIEIGEKKKVIEALQLEISTLQNSCREISQELSRNN
jgi:hypothetical protein